MSDEFCDIIRDLGEKIVIDYETSENTLKKVETYASIKNATEAAYNVTDREFLFKGDMVLPQTCPKRNISGMYFRRLIVPQKEYMFLTSIEQYIGNISDYRYIFAVQVNEYVDLCEQVEFTDENFNVTSIFAPYATNVGVYFTTVVRSQKSTQDGSLDQTIYNCMLPAKYKIAPDMRIRKNSFVVEQEQIDGKTVYTRKYKKTNYKVESVDTSLVVYDENKKSFTGVIAAQLSEDLRADLSNIDEVSGQVTW